MSNPNPKKHSFSRINTFTDICERRHAFDALIPGNWDTPPIKRGNHVHEGLDRLAKLMVQGRSATEAAEFVAENQPDGYLKEPVFASYMGRAVPVFKHLKPIKHKVEAWFEDVEGLAICGKIDLQSEWTPVFDGSGYPVHHIEGLCVIDHKTTGSPARIKSTYEAKTSLQLKIYCLATGARNAGFLYYLPTGAVRGVMVSYTQEELALAKRWLTSTLTVIDSRWRDALCLPGDPRKRSFGGFNLESFSLAKPGHGLCSEKHCAHWKRCLGKDSQNG